MLLALFSYEVGVSVVLAASLLVLMDRGDALRTRLRAFGPPILLCAAAWAALQAAVRLGPGMTSYYSASARLALENLSAIGLAFLHVRSGWVAPGVAAGLVIAGALVALLVLARDRVIRFGLAWSVLAWLPVAPIPFFSDRYHYIAFAGLAVAAGRALALLTMRSDRREPIPARESSPLQVEAASALPIHEAPAGEAAGSSVRADGVLPSAAARRAGRSGVLLAATLVLVHVLWSLAGAREQTAFWAVKGQVARMLFADASGAIAAAAGAGTGGSDGQPGDPGPRLVGRARFQRPPDRAVREPEGQPEPRWRGRADPPLAARRAPVSERRDSLGGREIAPDLRSRRRHHGGRLSRRPLQRGGRGARGLLPRPPAPRRRAGPCREPRPDRAPRPADLRQELAAGACRRPVGAPRRLASGQPRDPRAPRRWSRRGSPRLFMSPGSNPWTAPPPGPPSTARPRGPEAR